MASLNTCWLVVGGSRGIGLEYVKQVAESGARVIATARNVDKAPGLKALAQAHARERLQVVALDVTDAASLKAAAAEVAAENPGGIDYLIINAGTNDGHVGPSLDMDLADFRSVFEVNVIGAFGSIQAFYPLVKAKQGGKKVVAVLSSGEASSVSVSADAKDRGKPLAPMDVMQPAYRPSKAALNRLTIQLANEHKHDGATFVAMSPGAVATDMTLPFFPKLTKGMAPEKIAAMIDSVCVPVEESVKAQIELLTGSTQQELNGRFLGRTGADLSW